MRNTQTGTRITERAARVVISCISATHLIMRCGLTALQSSFVFDFSAREHRPRAYLDEVESHGHDCHSEDDVGGGGDHLEVVCGRLKSLAARYQVAEADGRDGDEAVIGGGQPVPALPDAEQYRAHEDEAGHETHRHCERHAHLLDVLVFIVVVVVVVIFDCMRNTTPAMAYHREAF